MPAREIPQLRPAVAKAFDVEYERLRRPGTWWDGRSRVAMVAQMRAAHTCGLCADRKEALSPYSLDRKHEADEVLSASVVDAVHRIATDPGRLTDRWLKETEASGVSVEQSVELVAVVAIHTTIDTYVRALGGSPRALPDPIENGEPSRERPSGAVIHSASVPTIPPERAKGELAKYYAAWKPLHGFVPNIIRALSLVPAEALAWNALIRVLDNGQLSQPQVELLSATTSALNECFY